MRRKIRWIGLILGFALAVGLSIGYAGLGRSAAAARSCPYSGAAATDGVRVCPYSGAREGGASRGCPYGGEAGGHAAPSAVDRRQRV